MSKKTRASDESPLNFYYHIAGQVWYARPNGFLLIGPDDLSK